MYIIMFQQKALFFGQNEGNNHQNTGFSAMFFFWGGGPHSSYLWVNDPFNPVVIEFYLRVRGI